MRSYCLCRRNETSDVKLGDFIDPVSCAVDSDRLLTIARRCPPQLTAVVMAYLPSMAWRLEKLVCGYGRAHFTVRKVLVLWNGPADQAPMNVSCARDWEWHAQGATARLRSGRAYAHRFVDLEVLIEDRNTLLNRYRHADRIPTETALLQDDDVVHSAAALRAFAWMSLALPKQILGTPPERDFDDRRRDEVKKRDQYAFGYIFRPRHSYSFLLGQTSVLKKSYLDSFLNRAPTASLKFIVSHKPTCEDLTLHFHVANETHLPPAVFQDLQPNMISGPRATQMHSSGSLKAWSKRRERCLDRLVGDYSHSNRDNMPLVKSSCRLTGNISIVDPVYQAAYFSTPSADFGRGVDDDLATLPFPKQRRRRRRKKKNTVEEGISSASSEQEEEYEDEEEEEEEEGFSR